MTIIEILELVIKPTKEVHPSSCKMIMCMIWLNQGKQMTVEELAKVSQVSVRATYRALKHLTYLNHIDRDNGVFYVIGKRDGDD